MVFTIYILYVIKKETMITEEQKKLAKRLIWWMIIFTMSIWIFICLELGYMVKWIWKWIFS